MAMIAMSTRPSGLGSLMTVMRTKVPPFVTRLLFPTSQGETHKGNEAANGRCIHKQGHRKEHDHQADRDEPVSGGPVRR